MSILSEQVKKFQAEAQRSDAQDPLKQLRNEFIVPTVQDLKSKTVLNRHCMHKSSQSASVRSTHKGGQVCC